MAVFSDFHARGKFEKSCNSTFISLIPKVSEASYLKDFRPISLVSGIYKIISKVLANRLRLVMDRIISNPQNAFVKDKFWILCLLQMKAWIIVSSSGSWGCFVNLIWRRPMIT
jgi:hypothetical protein